MGVSRRDFLKISGSTLLLGPLAAPAPADAKEQEIKTKGAKETTTVCPYCSVGCGIIVHTKDGKVVNTEGDPDHPINEGTLCPKGASIMQLVHNDTRVLKPMYRAPGADSLEGSGVGLGAGPDREEGEGHARPDVQAHVQVQGEGETARRDREGSRERVHREPDRRHRPRGQRGPRQRGMLPASEDDAVPGPGIYRTPGAHLTLRDCAGSGRVVRTRCNDESLDRPEEF